jgi:isochorismate pyruvate lyase
MTPVQRAFSGAPWESQVGYCRAIRVGAHIYLSGTAPVDEAGNVVAPGDAYAQAKQCFTIIQKTLRSLGADCDAVVRTRMLVTDIHRWQLFAQAHHELFANHPPVTTMVEVKALIDPAMLIEVEAEAILSATPPSLETEMPSPEACTNLQQVRSAIDQIDAQIIAALGKRLAYVKAAADFKRDESGVAASDRVRSILEQRRTWAQAANLDPDVIEQLYRDLVNYFITVELQHFHNPG